MSAMSLRQRIKTKPVSWIVAIALAATMLAAIGAGPDDPTASTISDDWEIYEGHAYADHRAAPAGVALIACLGGCDEGYASAPVITGNDGIYRVRVDPGQIQPDGRMVTFWLVDGAERVEADQDVLFRGNGETRVLDLNFIGLPESTSDRETFEPARQPGGTTDLTVPSADDLGLVPTGTPGSYVNSLSFGGIPLLPGFATFFGLILAAAGVLTLMYRRRLTW